MEVPHENTDLAEGFFSQEEIALYRDHCAGSSKHVLLVTAVFPPCDCGSDDCPDEEEPAYISNVFSSHEGAQEWIDSLDDRVAFVVVPSVIDDPMFGNETVN